MRRARLCEALGYVAETVKTGGEWNVMIGLSESDGTGPLARGGSMFAPDNGYWARAPLPLASRWALSIALCTSAALCTTCMPRPPPP